MREYKVGDKFEFAENLVIHGTYGRVSMAQGMMEIERSEIIEVFGRGKYKIREGYVVHVSMSKDYVKPETRDVLDIEIGDKVFIKEYGNTERPLTWNSEGLMDCYKGKMVVISNIFNSSFEVITPSFDTSKRKWLFNTESIDVEATLAYRETLSKLKEV